MKANLIQAERILSPTQISIAQYTINPYRGCSFGCIYCYTRENKSIKKRKEPWGSFIDVKINAVDLLKKEIKDKKIDRVLLGSTVECYPQEERQSKLTCDIIEILNENKIAVTILTKSSLLERDLKLISKFKGNKIYLTINFESDKLRNLFEPKSSPIKERLNLLKQINEHKINDRVHIAPLIPFIQNVDSIYRMVSSYTQEISIELYNLKMGNWIEIRKVVDENFGKKKTLNIEKIFLSKQNYKSYINQLKDKIDNLQQRLNRKITFISPDFDDYYKSDMVYE